MLLSEAVVTIEVYMVAIEQHRKSAPPKKSEQNSTMDRGVVTDPHAPELYSRKAITGFSVLVLPLFGSVLFAMNLWQKAKAFWLRSREQRCLTIGCTCRRVWGTGVGYFVTWGCSVRGNQQRFQNNSRFAAQVSRER